MRPVPILVLATAVLPFALTSAGCSEESSTNNDWAKPHLYDGGTGGSGGGGDGGAMDGQAGSKEGGQGGGVIIDGGGGSEPCNAGVQQDCYTGPDGTLGVGACKAGKATCAADGKSWGPCTGQVVPAPDSCLDSLDNDCNGIPNDGNHTAPGCACVPGSTKCENDHEVLCDAAGDWGKPGGLCCKVGQFTCDCDQVLECDGGNPPKWIPKTPALICNAASGQRCDAATGTCKALTTIGNTTPTGSYYQFAYFTTSNSPLKVTGNVDDIGSYGEYVYVNRGPWYSQGVAMDVYKISLEDTDGDGKLEPNQHPDNPLDPGPIEKRTLTFVATYTSAAPDNAPLGIAHRGEIIPAADRVFVLSAPNKGDVTEYILATKASNTVVKPAKPLDLSQLGYGAADGRWYGSHETPRRVFSFCPGSQTWVAEFQYPDLAGDHLDGMEVVVSFSTGVQYVYVSDMTSDFIAQYRRDSNGGWVQENVFKYNSAVAGDYVEGMGYGALKHFWIASGSAVYELGGGDLTGYLQ